MAYELARPATASQEERRDQDGLGGSGELSQVGLVRVRLAFGVLIAINVMALHLSFYATDLFGAAAVSDGYYAELSGLFGYLILFLSTVVFAMLGLPLLADAWSQGTLLPRPTAQLLIVLGVAAAFAISAVHTLTGQGKSYYDTVTMVLVIVTLGHYIEARARRQATQKLATALDGLPDRVEIRRDGRQLRVRRSAVRRGDTVRVRPGESVCVDGRVLSGRSHVDVRATTGESRPEALGPGDRVVSGSLLIDGELWVEASGPAAAGRLAEIQNALDLARQTRPRIQQLADKMAAVLMPAAVMLAVVSFGWLASQGRAEEGILRGLSVLLIACPCAFAIAPSLSLVGAMTSATRRGIVIQAPEVVERLAALRAVFFDKTGTLSASESDVVAVEGLSGTTRHEAIAMLAALEAASLHPIARGVARLARAEGIEAPSPEVVTDCRVLPGLGVEGVYRGRLLRIGGMLMLRHSGLQNPTKDPTSIYLMSPSAVLARVEICEGPRPEASRALAELRELGISVSGLSGDTQAAADCLANKLELPIHGELISEEKVRRIESQRRTLEGRGTIAMVGDGINDAPALAAADVGVALGEGTPLSHDAGHVLLTQNRLTDLPQAIRLSRAALRRIGIVLGASLTYNAFGIALALGGWLQPAFAASAMVVSSLLVLSCTTRQGVQEAAPPVPADPATPPQAKLARGSA